MRGSLPGRVYRKSRLILIIFYITPLVIRRRFFYVLLMPYRFSDKYSTADAGIIVTGRTVEELFCDAALGMTEILVDLEDLESGRQLTVELDADSMETLFFDWLSEIIYLKDAESFLLKKCVMEIKSGNRIILQASLSGDTIDPNRHTLKVDVKAVTFYRLKVEQVNDHWQGEAVFDL